MAYIKLSIAGFSITFSKFFANSIPRIVPTENSLEYSAYGTPVLNGTTTELPHVWNVDAPCDISDYLKLLALQAESDLRRRTGQDWRITVEDTTLPLVEKSPRTRGIISGGSETTIAGTGVTYISYPAKYYGWIVKRPEFRELGKGWGVSFTMQEAGVFPA